MDETPSTPSSYSWERLNTVVQALLTENNGRWTYAFINDNPFTTTAILKSLEKGVKVAYVTYLEPDKAILQRDGNGFLIEISDALNPFEHDVTFLHELVHVYYHPHLNDVWRNSTTCYNNNAITEWLARKARTDPEILRLMYNILQRPPCIYDRASHEAFSDQLQQKEFDFLKEYYRLRME